MLIIHELLLIAHGCHRLLLLLLKLLLLLLPLLLHLLFLFLLQFLLLDDIRIVVQGLVEFELLHFFAVLDLLVLRDAIPVQLLTKLVVFGELLLLLMLHFLGD